MSKYSEKTKKYIRFFAENQEPKTIDDLISYLNVDDREAKIGSRKIRHTIGDLVYRGVLKPIRCKDNKRKCKYKLTLQGSNIAAEFHSSLPEPIRSMTIAEKDTEHSDTIPKENDLAAPPTPVAKSRSRKQPTLTIEDSLAKFKELYARDPDKAILLLVKDHLLVRQAIRDLKGS